MLRKLLFASAFLAAAAPAFAAVAFDPTHVLGVTPDQIQWREGGGAETAWVVGDMNKPGPCLELVKWRGGHFSKPHFHGNPRYAVVMSGTWWVSTSHTYDPANNMVGFPAGSVVTDQMGGEHYDGAKAETGDAEVAIFMECPYTEGHYDDNGKRIAVGHFDANGAPIPAK